MNQSRDRSVKLSRGRWLTLLTFSWVLVWVLYTPSLLFQGPGTHYDGFRGHEVFLFFVPRNETQSNYLLSVDDYSSGGVYESIPVAAAIGGLLFLGALFAGWRWPRSRLAALLAFIFVYIAALILLCTVIAPSVWGPVTFLTD